MARVVDHANLFAAFYKLKTLALMGKLATL